MGTYADESADAYWAETWRSSAAWRSCVLESIDCAFGHAIVSSSADAADSRVAYSFASESMASAVRSCLEAAGADVAQVGCHLRTQ